MGILLNALTEYGKSDFYPYHMPGHKRRALEDFPQSITDIDITEIAGFDNLHQPEGLLLEAQKRAADAYGAEESFFLINGSTCGILSAVSAAIPFGGHLLISRNCHKSVFHAAYLRQLRLSYIWPQEMVDFDICEAVTPEQVAAELDKNPGVHGVLIVSPTYEGRIADIKSIAEVVHRRNIPLIVDEAHGAHLGFCRGFAENSARLGADLVINSVHKTLPAMTQTALLHCNGKLINRELLKRYLHIYQSSSPSYVMMASIDHAVSAAAEGEQLFQKFHMNWQRLLERLQLLCKLKILPGLPGVDVSHDVGKLIISTSNTRISGNQLSGILRDRYHLEMEMACETFVLAMFTIADTEEGYDRLTEALLEIDAGLPDHVGSEGTAELFDVSVKEQIPYYKAWDCEKEWIPLKLADKRLAGEFINLYPPGTPILVPGEMLDEKVIQKILCCMKGGLEVQGVYRKDDSSEPMVQVIYK